MAMPPFEMKRPIRPPGRTVEEKSAMVEERFDPSGQEPDSVTRPPGATDAPEGGVPDGSPGRQHRRRAENGLDGATRRERGRPASRRRTVLRRVGLAFLVLVLAVTGGLWYVVHRLEGNVRAVSLSGSPQGIDAASGKPLNILLVGSDSRNNSANCELGGACPSSTPTATSTKNSDAAIEGNADVQMLVHLSADRKHAEVVSIPRDTIVQIPDCVDSGGADHPARRGRINSSLEAGPDCTVRTVSQLTGLSIPHVAVIDFQGVVTMTNALGGVPVCVDNNVYDPYSHLKLSKGTHEVKGTSALEFVRTRHGFGNGGDLVRASAQHLFLSSLIRTVRSTDTLANPVKLYRVADAATSALTVDKQLASASQLVALVKQLDKVPTKNITFMTMPTEPDPANPNVLLPAASANALWSQLSRDAAPDAAATATPSPSSSPSATSTPSAAASPSTPTPAFTSPSPTTPTSSASDATEGGRTADAQGCAQVSTRNTVEINGVAMSPIQAYDAAPNVPDSDK